MDTPPIPPQALAAATALTLVRPTVDGPSPPVIDQALPSWIRAEYTMHHKLWELTELQDVLRATQGNRALEEMWIQFDAMELKIAPASESAPDIAALPRSRLLPLARLLHRAIRGYGTDHKRTVAQRRAIANRIRTWTSRLARELKSLSGDARPSAWADAIHDARSRVSDSLARTHLRRALSEERFGEEQRVSDFIGGWTAGISDLFYEPSAMLEAVSEAATEWADHTPVLPRPKVVGADRLFFFRIMGTFFVARYGQPLHDWNIALSEVFFDTDSKKYPTATPEYLTHIVQPAQKKLNRKKKAT